MLDLILHLRGKHLDEEKRWYTDYVRLSVFIIISAILPVVMSIYGNEHGHMMIYLMNLLIGLSIFVIILWISEEVVYYTRFFDPKSDDLHFEPKKRIIGISRSYSDDLLSDEELEDRRRFGAF